MGLVTTIKRSLVTLQVSILQAHSAVSPLWYDLVGGSCEASKAGAALALICRKGRDSEGNSLLQGHPAGKWQIQESWPGSLHQAPLSTLLSNQIVTTHLGRASMAQAQALWQDPLRGGGPGIVSPESGNLEASGPGCGDQESVLETSGSGNQGRCGVCWEHRMPEVGDRDPGGEAVGLHHRGRGLKTTETY